MAKRKNSSPARKSQRLIEKEVIEKEVIEKEVSQSPKAKKRKINPKNAPVPEPTIDHLTPFISLHHNNCSLLKQEKQLLREATHAANLWNSKAPTFRIQGVVVGDLSNRKKNAEEDKKLADKTIEAMKKDGAEADACSAKYVDEDGSLLAEVFSNRVVYETKSKKKDKKATTMNYPGSKGRTSQDVANAPESTRRWDGLPNEPLERYHEATQILHMVLEPLANSRDIRHPDEDVMEYKAEYYRDGVEEKSQYERSGVTHLVHAWVAQGHRNAPLYASADMRGCGGSDRANHVKYYFKASRPVALYLQEYFQVCFPTYFAKYEAAFQAGIWEYEDPGPWIGRAIVWKLQVNTHVDGLDDGPTAIFNVGNYTGGELYLPDLNLKIIYRPGEVVILLSGILYNHVAKWEPTTHNNSKGLTPGRIGNVFFFPKDSLNLLTGKPAGWYTATLTGRKPSADVSREPEKGKGKEKKREEPQGEHEVEGGEDDIYGEDQE